MSLYEEHLARTMAAIKCEPVDRVPFSYLGTAANAHFVGASMARYCTDMEYNCTTNLEGIEMIGEVDSVQATIFFPDILPTSWLSQVCIPGRELPDGELWQIHEQELVQAEDYDKILEGGFGPWLQQFLVEKLDDPLAKAGVFFGYMGTSIGRFAEAGIPLINGANLYSPFEMFCGGRSMIPFFTEDLLGQPEKVDRVFQAAQTFNLEQFGQQLNNPAGKPIGAWIGGWRGTPSALSTDMFERFSWKYMRELIDLVLESGVVPILHLDSNWDRGIHYIKELPKHSVVVALDGQTDIFEARKVLGSDQCIMGDVPAAMLAFGTRETVENYCAKLIAEVGPTGFILCSGCDTPYNAKLENVQAMSESVKMAAQ